MKLIIMKRSGLTTPEEAPLRLQETELEDVIGVIFIMHEETALVHTEGPIEASFEVAPSVVYLRE